MTIVCSRCGGEHMRSECSASGAVNEELRYAHRLATALWDKHYRADAPDWKPLPDLLGTLTQIDNMCSGLTLDDVNSPLVKELAEEIKILRADLAGAADDNERYRAIIQAAADSSFAYGVEVRCFLAEKLRESQEPINEDPSDQRREATVIGWMGDIGGNPFGPFDR